jgi:iron(III) transport system permease protein
MWRVHLPLLRVALLSGALLVFVETIKELPATVLLRPLGGDTLATAVWQSTSESLWQAAAPPAVAIIAVALVPVIVLVRTLEHSERAETFPS